MRGKAPRNMMDAALVELLCKKREMNYEQPFAPLSGDRTTPPIDMKN